MKFANEEERRRYFRELGRKGGKTTAEKYGSEHMAKIGRKGFEVTTKKYFQGDNL
jgi:general stress protein YciG